MSAVAHHHDHNFPVPAEDVCLEVSGWHGSEGDLQPWRWAELRGLTQAMTLEIICDNRRTIPEKVLALREPGDNWRRAFELCQVAGSV